MYFGAVFGRKCIDRHPRSFQILERGLVRMINSLIERSQVFNTCGHDDKIIPH